ncbi:MAG: hypothetical protein AAFZ52_19310, partial [Bacteroidota bacterium]
MSAATDYIQSYANYFWHYEERGKVIAVPGGNTLGYTDRVINEMVVHLAPQGLPRFGALLLAIAATTAQGQETLEDIMELVGDGTDRNVVIQKGLWFAKSLTRVPAKIKQGNLRILLLQAVFSHQHNHLGQKTSAKILRELRENPSYPKDAAATRGKVLTRLEIIKTL